MGSLGARRRLLLGSVALAAAALGLALAVGAWGGDGDRPEDFEVAEDVAPLGDLRAGSVASLVDCEDWSGGSVERRQATVVAIREQLSSGGTIQGRPSLDDQAAYDVFERACANEFASAFRLYKLYYQANAFEGLDPYEYAKELEASGP